MRFIQHLLNEMAKRATPEQFSALAIKKYGKEKCKSLTMAEVVAVAKENDLQVPSYIIKQKVARARFNAVYSDVKAEPAKDEKKPVEKKKPDPAAVKAAVKRMAGEVIAKTKSTTTGDKATDAEMKAALNDVKYEMNQERTGTMRWNSFEFRGPEKYDPKDKGWEISVCDWGKWEITPEQYTDMEDESEAEDYDWETFMDGEKLNKLLKKVEKQHPKVKLSFSAEEKNWLHIYAE